MAIIETSLKEEVNKKLFGLIDRLPWVEAPKRSPKVTAKECCELHPLDLVPLKKRVEIAFDAVPLENREKRVIEALMLYPESSSIRLSKACGWAGPIWHIHLGAICQRRIDWLLPIEFMEYDSRDFIHGILVEYLPDSASFKFKPEVIRAFRAMGLGAN